MSELAIKKLRQELMRLYETKEYIQALELVEKEQANFPTIAREISYWRLSMNTLLGKQAEALHAFQEVLDRNDWIPPKWVGKDPNLVSLHPLPAFQGMIEVCRQRLAELQMNTQPLLLVRQPTEQGTVLPLLIALHGNGEHASMSVDHWSGITTQGWLLAVPQSTQVFERDAFVWDERETGTSEVCAHLATLSSEHNIDQERVMLGGFSMGGGQAIWMALHQSIKTRGFVVLGPYLREAELEALRTLLETHRPAQLHGTILVGEEDAGCLAVSRKIVEMMRAHDLSCELEIRSGLDHIYPENFAAWVAKGLAFIEQS